MNRRRVLRGAAWTVVALLGLPTLLLFVAALLTPLPAALAPSAASSGVRVEDRTGQLLREVRADDGSRASWIPRAQLGDTLVQAVLAAEDRHFYWHPGVDPVSVGRAGLLALWHRRLVSGASTLTMQLARTVAPHPKTLRGKLGEMALALRIEGSLSKDRILEEYMNRVSFGPNLRGVGAASQAFFGKSPANLSVAEAAFVAGMARGPSLYDVTKRPELARARRDRVIGRMARDGWIDRDAAERAKGEPVTLASGRAAFGAPHFVAALLRRDFDADQPGLKEALTGGVPTRLLTTLDPDLQRTAEAQVAATVHRLAGKGVTAASAIVLDNATGDVLAYVGSPDFFDDGEAGQNDGVRALRQPGSTLKPFLYELAMEKLGFDPSTALPDVDLHLDVGLAHDYAPHDYDGKVRGPVRLREALGNSLNIPAVWTAHAVGIDAFEDRLHALGFTSLEEEPDYYGPGLALGDGEVTLLALARAYATLAARGVLRPLRVVSRVTWANGEVVELPVVDAPRLMPAPLVDLVVDVLKDHDAREASFGERTVLDFPFEVAAKTGTSKGFRDNWTAGFTKSLTVAVWVGSFGGQPMTNVSGITGAGPLFHAILEAASFKHGARNARDEDRLPIDPADHEGLQRVEVCTLSGELATDDCPHHVSEWRPEGSVDVTPCTMHERVRIDRRTGLRAGPGCAPGDVESRVFERFPADLLAWAAAAKRPVAPREWSPSCPGEDGSLDDPSAGPVRIAYPVSGARYVIDPDEPRALQALDVRIVAPPSTREVVLEVDGQDAARVRAPFTVSWPLAAGAHAFVAVADGVRSETVRVNVRE